MDTTDLRDRMAVAMREDLKRRTVPPIYGPCGHPINSGMGLTEFELADAALAVVQPELDRLTEEVALAVAHDRQPYPTAHAYEQACAALDQHRQRADQAETERDGTRASVVAYCERMIEMASEMGGGDPQAMAAYRSVARAFRRAPDGA